MNTFYLILWDLYLFLQLCVASFLLQPFLLLIIFIWKKIFTGLKNKQENLPGSKQFQFGIIVTVHRDSKFIHPIIDSLLKQTYRNFNAYVVADDCDTALLPRFEDRRIHILMPPEALNSNTKSINYALKHFSSADEVIVIFDPDNLIHPEFLQVLNGYYNRGFEAVQGNMYPKNMDSLYEKIDSVGVIFNNFIDREIRNDLNLSVNTWGCGVSLKREIYDKIKYDERSTYGGFDKHLQSEVAKNIPRLAYAKEAIFFDEKITSGDSLEKQRTRWIRAYFKFLPDAFNVFFTGIRRLNFNVMYFGYNLVRPPYFFQILLGLLLMVTDYFMNPFLSLLWLILLLLFLVSFATIILVKKKDKAVLQGLWYAPVFFIHQLRSLLKLKQNKNSILKTENSKVLYIKDMITHEDS